MAETDFKNPVLISVRPEFADMIFTEKKRVEFRRKVFKRDVSWVAVYVSKPVGLVVAVFRIGMISTGTPDYLWSRFRQVAGINYADFHQYFYGIERGYAIHIEDLHKLKEPLQLSFISPNLYPPQSYSYLSSDAAAIIQSMIV